MSFTEFPLRQNWDQELPRYYFDNSPFKTHLLNALSVTFPHGERFFIDSVKNYLDKITDPAQKKDISVFVKQENWHRYAHQQYNKWLEQIGLPAVHLESLANIKLEWTKRKFGPRGQLSVTVSMEHITAIFAEWMLSNPEILKSMHPHFQDIWRWHSIEELEHKSVAMNTLNAIGGGRLRKAMILTTINFIYDITRNTIVLLKTDKQLWKWRTVKDACSLLFNRNNGLITKLAAPWFDFMRKDFHPNYHSHTALLNNYSKA
jgi:predicted metal-dependent hydrolase